MLKMIFAGLLLIAAPAFADPVGDGCYLVRRPDAMSGAICISGSMVLSLDTAGQVLWCGRSTRSSVDQGRTVYHFGASSQIVSIAFEGTRDFGKMTIVEAMAEPYLLAYTDHTLRLIDRMPRFFASAKCMSAR